MSLIIDISDKLFDTFKKHGVMAFDHLDEYDKDKLAVAIANGTPYDPTGNLTEAEKKICKIYLEDLDKTHTCNEYKLLMSLIDNAPTVKPEKPQGEER